MRHRVLDIYPIREASRTRPIFVKLEREWSGAKGSRIFSFRGMRRNCWVFCVVLEERRRNERGRRKEEVRGMRVEVRSNAGKANEAKASRRPKATEEC